jgi:ligand-binding sensor domain-containing protein
MNTWMISKTIQKGTVLLLLLIFGGPPSYLSAQELFRFGTPFIQHFTKKEYHAGNQNWSITQDEHGFIYVGNSNGLLQYDGNRWKKYNLPAGTIVRSVFSADGRIYCGSLGELGYWEKDKNFNLKYTSLNRLLEGHNFGDEEIWWIIQYNGKIIFQSFTNTFLYDGERIEIIVSGKGVIFPPFVLNGRLFIQVLSEGLYEVNERETIFVPGSEVLISKRVNAMLPFSGTAKILIATEDDGFFTLSDNNLNVWPVRGNQSIIKDRINRGVKIRDRLFAIGTLLGGIYIVNEDGEIINQIDKKKGLNNNTILSLCVDKTSNLWVGMDNGVDHIRINSPVYYNTDVTGDIGSVYASVIFGNDLYLGTNRGVFYTPVNSASVSTEDAGFKLIPGSQGQVWSLEVIDDKLFCGHNLSTFIIEKHALRKVSDIAGSYQIKQYPFDEKLIVQGSYNGLSLLKKNESDWVFSHIIPGFQKLSKKIEFERENVLWVAHTHMGLYRLELNEDLSEILEIREFSPNLKTYVNKLNKKVIMSSDSGYVYYDDIQNTFFQLNDINKSLGTYSNSAHIISAGQNIYWIFKDGNCARVVMDENKVYALNDRVLKDLSEYLIPGYESIYVIDSALTIIHLDNGYAVYNNSWVDKSPDYQPPLLVRNLSFSALSGENFETSGDYLEIPYRYNNFKLLLSYPEFTGNTGLLYKLEGYDERWLNMHASGEISFQNLPDGDYILKIIRNDGSDETALELSFAINPPWFRSSAATAVYILVVLMVLTISIVVNQRKIKRIYRQHELERTQLLQKEAEENEKKLIRLRNENLRNEIKLRNSKLAKSTFSLIHKNNTLIAVKEELTKIKEDLGVRFPSKHFNRLIRNIDQDLTSEQDWDMFEQSFNEVHENFLHKLKEEFTDLTPADIQLCAYLKMNLQSKEIAALLNITVRGVEIRRYRLRKKLHLDHNINLTEYIMGY